MQVLFEKYPDLTILPFPCNSFGSQEPHDNQKIRLFANETMGYKGQIFGKIKCDNGDETHPFYKALMNSLDNGVYGPGLKWNFAKFLCGPDGVPIKRYSPKTNPLAFEDDIAELM